MHGLRAVLVQLRKPGDEGFTETTFRHIIARELASKYIKFKANIKNYLGLLNMSYKTYVKAVYSGDIWCDKFMLLAIALMFNISITIVSPVLATPWKIGHKEYGGAIILVANGIHFGTTKAETGIKITTLGATSPIAEK